MSPITEPILFYRTFFFSLEQKNFSYRPPAFRRLKFPILICGINVFSLSSRKEFWTLTPHQYYAGQKISAFRSFFRSLLPLVNNSFLLIHSADLKSKLLVINFPHMSVHLSLGIIRPKNPNLKAPGNYVHNWLNRGLAKWITEDSFPF